MFCDIQRWKKHYKTCAKHLNMKEKHILSLLKR